MRRFTNLLVSMGLMLSLLVGDVVFANIFAVLFTVIVVFHFFIRYSAYVQSLCGYTT